MGRLDIGKQVMVAIETLVQEHGVATAPEIVGLTGFKTKPIHNQLSYLFRHGKIERLGLGRYKLPTKHAGEFEQVATHLMNQFPNKSPNPLEVFGAKFQELPDIFIGLIDTIVDLMIEPEMEIVNLIERRNRRISDMQVLLEQRRIELSNSRAKITELVGKINSLSSQKNRVIPEYKVVFRDGKK